MAELIDAVKAGNLAAIKAALASGQNINAVDAQGRGALHHAATMNRADMMELLLQQPSVQCDLQDPTGLTALHLAVASSDVVRLLLSYGASAQIADGRGKRPVDLAKDPDVRTILAEHMMSAAHKDEIGTTRQSQSSIANRNLIQMRNEMMQKLEAELPNDVAMLKGFIIDLLLTYQSFQERCKEAIHQLIEEKYVALHKYRLLDNAAGFRDGDDSKNYLNQLQYLQTESEQQAATIAYLKA